MARKIIVEFERGGVFTADLLDDLAPSNCELIWNMLPITLRPFHGMVSGESFVGKLDELEGKISKENPRVFGVEPGSIGLEDVPVGTTNFPPGILVVYGRKFYFKTPFTPEGEPIWYIARIREKLDELYAIGQRILYHGEENMTIRKAEE